LFSIVVVGPGGNVVTARSVVAVGSAGTPGPRAIPVSSSINRGASLGAVGATIGIVVVVTTEAVDPLSDDDGEQLAKISAPNNAVASDRSKRKRITASVAAQQ
jgi:hypothetical protein